jgi:hypothetical protein
VPFSHVRLKETAKFAKPLTYTPPCAIPFAYPKLDDLNPVDDLVKVNPSSSTNDPLTELMCRDIFLGLTSRGVAPPPLFAPVKVLRECTRTDGKLATGLRGVPSVESTQKLVGWWWK